MLTVSRIRNQGVLEIVRKLTHTMKLESCSSIGDSFCIKHVPNSFCLTEKNECFCKYGYYSIQEDDGIMCKTSMNL
ncbi:Endoglin antigen [Schistosoma japonicum]|nr:Endoglin antigen [Schistosoma japonicum]